MEEAPSLFNFVVMGKMLFGLTVVLCLMGLLVLLTKYLQRKKGLLAPSKTDLKIIHTTHTGPKQKLTVVDWEGAHYLIALSPSGGFLIDKKPLNRQDEKSVQKNA